MQVSVEKERESLFTSPLLTSFQWLQHQHSRFLQHTFETPVNRWHAHANCAPLYF